MKLQNNKCNKQRILGHCKILRYILTFHCWYIEPPNREKSQKINNRRATYIPASRGCRYTTLKSKDYSEAILVSSLK